SSNVPSLLIDCRLSKSSSGQFCDSVLEVAFRQHTCFIRNLDGVDLLTGSRGNNLYTLSLQDIMASSSICLLSKASKTKSWLWHRHLSHLNFGAINYLARQGLVRGLSKLKFKKDHLCSACAMDDPGKAKGPSPSYPNDNGNKFVNQTLRDYYEEVGISHETLVARSLQQNEVVERRNHTLIEAAHTIDDNLDIEVAPMRNDPLFGVPIPEVTSAQSSSTVKLDELGGILKNKARLVARGYRQEEGIDFEESFAPKSKLDEDREGKAVDPSHYLGMIGTLLYLTASRPDLQFAICMCARYQARPTEKHVHAVKRIFRYLRGTVHRERLISWSSKRQKSAAISSTEAEYIALFGCCAQILWMRSQLSDYGLGFNKIPMYCDNKSAIALCCNNVQQSQSKHIDIRYHIIKEQVENGVIELYFVNTEYQLADLFTKALGRDRIEFLINKLGM
nr:hypothetical protein [Tanacetum cinerariifolium]